MAWITQFLQVGPARSESSGPTWSSLMTTASAQSAHNFAGFQLRRAALETATAAVAP